MSHNTDTEMTNDDNLEAPQDSNHEVLKQREDNLPEWLKAEVERYRTEAAEDPGYTGDFDVDFLDYILVVATLASFYAAAGERIIGYNYLTMPPELVPDAVRAFSDRAITTGAQHSLAISLANNYLIDQAKADASRLFTGFPSVPDVSFKARFASTQ